MMNLERTTKIRRTFQPVGQGAFYTEEFFSKEGHVDFRVVYDCGTKTSKNLVNPAEVINGVFKDVEVIDILFISHFDADHVSMLNELCRNRTIRIAVLPLIPMAWAAILSGVYNAVNNAIGIQLLLNPMEFFGEKTTVLRVAPPTVEVGRWESQFRIPVELLSDRGEVQIRDPQGKRIHLERGCVEDIPSGSSIFIPAHSWCYVPHNYEWGTRHEMLQQRLEARSDIDSSRLDDAKYVCGILKELNEIYRSLKKDKCGDVNENSLLVYSGPCGIESASSCFCAEMHLPVQEGIWYDHFRPACVFSGDSDFKKVKISDVFHFCWENVGTVQIPHHGSIRSFASEFLDSGTGLVCPISAKKGNIKHPAPAVVKEILEKHSYPFLVDEMAFSKLIQDIYIGWKQ